MFRAPSSVIGLVVAVALAVVLLGDAALRAGVGAMLLLAPWILLAVWAVYALLYAPHVRISADGIRIQNPLRVTDIAWARVREIDLQWQLRVLTDEQRTYKAFGGPVAGRPGRPPLRRDDVADRGEPPAIRDLVVIRDAWEASRDSAPPAGPIHRFWHIPSVVSLLALIVWVIIALFISGGVR
ncbi:PH domain-containing protein [Microbacterium proteolyticum]|uniref:PH domain-containing protein n=1 Tax=Microbacterium proteolyticum TaxID=1572644 RepID=UPI001FAB6A91|nr:PH domain-containing protein [Microbacterium proteolyticum]MCI9858138.1 PH domain-containing protein [Microbacterium proteolyticum]